MIFNLLISIVFIAELIIAFTIILNLIKLDKSVNNVSEVIAEITPSVRELMETARKLSEQFAELAPYWADKIKTISLEFLLSNLKGLLAGAAIFSIKKKFKLKRIVGLRLLKIVRFLDFC